MAYETTVALAAFVCLAVAGLASLFLHGRLPEIYRDDKTLDIVRQVGGIFVMLGSLVLGLMVSSASSNFDDIGKAVHTYGTDLILLDRALRPLGADGEAARAELLGYVSTVVASIDIERPATSGESHTAEETLRDISGRLNRLQTADPDRAAARDAAKAEVATLLRSRWMIIDRTEGTLPFPLVASMVLWFAMVMASFGYRAPRNAVVATSFVVASALLAGAIYLILDMARPFDGEIQASSAPFIHALAELKQ